MNWLGGAETQEGGLLDKAKELIIPQAQKNKNKLLSDFKYYYDEVIFLQMTRYEVGLWIIFTIFFLMKKALVTCGDRKTVFDYMRPA